MIVILGCGKAKRPGRHQAYAMYSGSTFRQHLRAAMTLTPLANIYVLSARHGLLHLTDEIDAYEQEWDRAGVVGFDTLQGQIERYELMRAYEVVVLASGIYVMIARMLWPWRTHRVIAPLEGLGEGDALHVSKLIRQTGSLSGLAVVVQA